MDWVLDHLQILIFVAIAGAAVLQRFKKATGQAESGSAKPVDPEEEARTRRIQEEIRRRILERRGLAPAAPPVGERAPQPASFPAAPPLIEAVRQFRVEPPAEAAAPSLEAQRAAAELKRQQELAERIRALESSRRVRATVAAESAASAMAAAADRPLPDLRNHAGLRRAILLREILGPPVGLR